MEQDLLSAKLFAFAKKFLDNSRASQCYRFNRYHRHASWQCSLSAKLRRVNAGSFCRRLRNRKYDSVNSLQLTGASLLIVRQTVRDHYGVSRELVSALCFLLGMTGSLEDEIRRVREQANMLAEEVRILQEHNDERTEQAIERARKSHKRLDELLSRREKEGG